MQSADLCFDRTSQEQTRKSITMETKFTLQPINDVCNSNPKEEHTSRDTDAERYLQSSDNSRGSREQMDLSKVSECQCCSSLHLGFGLEDCPDLMEPIGRHEKFENKSIENWPINRTSQESIVGSTDSGNHCTCNRFGGNSKDLSCLDSFSPLDSVTCDHENADELQDIEATRHLTLGQPKDLPQPSESYASRIEELQLDLLECALEYEVKILEMKMKMVQMKSQSYNPSECLETDVTFLQSSTDQTDFPNVSGQLEKMLSQRLDTCRKKMNRLQAQRDSFAEELLQFRKKQRKFELQKRNLDDSLRRVNNLQRKLMKKEEEMVECQLREKEARARLHELQVALQRSKAKNFEPEKLVKLIPTIRSWLRSLKKTGPIKSNQRQIIQIEQFEAVLGRILESAPPEMLKRQGQLTPRKVGTNSLTPRMEHSAPVDCINEVYALQKELQRLASTR